MQNLFNKQCLRRSLIICFIGVFAWSAHAAATEEDNELLELFKSPLVNSSYDVEAKQENYSSESESRALSVPRSLFSDLNKRPLIGEPDIENNKRYAYVLGAYDTVSTGGLDGWDYSVPFKMPIVVWDNDKPAIKVVNQDSYLVELNKYSDSEVLAYMVKGEAAYVVLRLKNEEEFQIIELAWSDRHKPYFTGFYFQTSTDPVPATRSAVFNSEFIMKLKVRLLGE